MVGAFLLGLVLGGNLVWVFLSSTRRDGYWREFSTRRRGGNPPPPGRKPAPPAGPPEQPLAAQLIRYWAWEQEQVRRAWLDDPIRMDEGRVQRGGFGDGPTTPKPPIKPQPTGGHLVREGQMWGGYQPRPQGGTPVPPPSEP
jgi:hypothetical protein